MATDSTPWWASQSASSVSWSVVVPKSRTFGLPSALVAGPHTQCWALPTSRPATLGRMTGSDVGRGVSFFRLPVFLGMVIKSPHAAMAIVGPAASAAELEVPATAVTVRYDLEDGRLGDWKTIDGTWAIEAMAGAPSGRRVLVQRAVENVFNVIVAPVGPYADVDASVQFKPMSGREDASGGIVFRFHDGTYYVIRANALENNFNLYYYDRGRREITGVRVQAPALGQWHTARVGA